MQEKNPKEVHGLTWRKRAVLDFDGEQRGHGAPLVLPAAGSTHLAQSDATYVSLWSWSWCRRLLRRWSTLVCNAL